MKWRDRIKRKDRGVHGKKMDLQANTDALPIAALIHGDISAIVQNIPPAFPGGYNKSQRCELHCC